MSDEQGQEKPRFEPPPWEREAFEALAARRAEEEAVQAILDAEKADRAAARAADEVVVASAAAPVPEVVEEPVAPVAPVVQAPRAAGSANDRQVQAMMLQLQREEYTDGKGAKIVGWIASAITVVLGISMLVAGLRTASGADGKAVAVMGSAVLSIFGLCFIGMSVWVWVRTTRLKGR